MVELRGVTKRFGSDVVAVDAVDLDVRAGEFLTLLGPSGCGKTTVLRMISGLETPTEGRVLLDRRDVTDLPPYRRDVNQVFQSYALFPHLSVRDNVAFGLRMKRLPRGEIERRVVEVIELVAMSGLESRRPDQLSGGQRQRVALARAIVNRPKVLLLDEPLAALDAKLRRGMQLELKALQHRLGITFVFVTHDQEEALTMSDRIAVMNAGRIEQIGDAGEVYRTPATTFVAAFIGQANILEMRVVGRPNQTTTRLTHEDVTIELPRRVTGDTARVAIRPEKIRLTRAPGEATTSLNCFAAIVVEELFRGEVDQLLLRTPGGVELTVVVANQSAIHAAIHRGDLVRCQVHPQDVVVLDD